MIVKRAAQLKLLEEQYYSSGNNLVILYGRKGLGKTTLLTEFMEDKPSYYYAAMECEDLLQRSLMASEWRKATGESADHYYNLVQSIRTYQQKTVIVIDEFHYIVKNSNEFMEILKVLADPEFPVMLILVSSSIRWIENDMLELMGTKAEYITAYLKLKEFTFVDFVNRFPKTTVEGCVFINAVLGGVPEYLKEWQEDLSVKDNILQTLYHKDHCLFLEPLHYLKLELREPAVYNTILSVLAKGNRKLNELHVKTGYSRAKISVYLKHLIELDLVEKLVPLGDEGRENVQKGLYRIRDNFFSFWYRFVFPHMSLLLQGKAHEVYEKELEPYLDEYMGEYFSDVCTEYLKLMNLHQRLPRKYLWWDRWYGKNGTIDILAQGEKNFTLVGRCLWEDRKLEVADYENLRALSAEAGIDPDYCYLFSRRGFAQELNLLAREKKDIILVGLDDL
ncbi:MAG: putative ATPase superfamily [Herbinix sp.]|jgi:AAA+ ATPase superfamily predicted ATPase|nr:putative ATPase superfamily [Herbinix sp.]